MSDDKRMNIPDEAVEAAAKAMAALGEADNGESGWPDFARLALEAAAPHLMAQAWDEGYQGCYGRYMYEPVPPNPYRSAGAGE